MFHASLTFQRYQFHLDAELSLEKGSITALIGASGSGKSSLFRLLCGLEKPLTGQIKSDDVYWFDADKKIDVAVQSRKVGMVFQDYALFEHLTVYENIAYGVEKANQSKVVSDWLSRINLNHKANAYPQVLSGGEKQRVALARALATSPDILLLDEPFSALDNVIRHELRRELQLLISDAQIPVLIATHDLVEARFLADTLYLLSDGKIIQHGPASSVFKKPETIEAAKILGWQNILNVESHDDKSIAGKWGELSCGETMQIPTHVDAVAIPLDALTPILPATAHPATAHPATKPVSKSVTARRNPDRANLLSTTLKHRADMGDFYLVEAQLADGSHITAKISMQDAEKLPDSGQNLSFFVDLSRLMHLIQ